MSRHATPASARARRMAIAPISIPVTSPKRPNGCRPTPTIATSTPRPPYARSSVGPGSADGPEGEGDDLVPRVVGGERPEHELHVHADPQPVRFREARLDPHLVAELHVPHSVRREGFVRGARKGGRGRRELLGRPGPEAAPPGPPVPPPRGRREARARVLRGERDDPARDAAAPDQPRIVGGPGED